MLKFSIDNLLKKRFCFCFSFQVYKKFMLNERNFDILPFFNFNLTFLTGFCILLKIVKRCYKIVTCHLNIYCKQNKHISIPNKTRRKYFRNTYFFEFVIFLIPRYIFYCTENRHCGRYANK